MIGNFMFKYFKFLLSLCLCRFKVTIFSFGVKVYVGYFDADDTVS